MVRVLFSFGVASPNKEKYLSRPADILAMYTMYTQPKHVVELIGNSIIWTMRKTTEEDFTQFTLPSAHYE